MRILAYRDRQLQTGPDGIHLAAKLRKQTQTALKTMRSQTLAGATGATGATG